MINITVDEAYAFDYLSILEVKKNNSPVQFIAYEKCRGDIARQIGEEYCEAIIGSKQYKNLFDTNKKIYDLIDDIRKGREIFASVIDELNSLRYYHKTELQKIFFDSDMMIEKKN